MYPSSLSFVRLPSTLVNKSSYKYIKSFLFNLTALFFFNQSCTLFDRTFISCSALRHRREHGLGYFVPSWDPFSHSISLPAPKMKPHPSMYSSLPTYLGRCLSNITPIVFLVFKSASLLSVGIHLTSIMPLPL